MKIHYTVKPIRKPSWEDFKPGDYFFALGSTPGSQEEWIRVYKTGRIEGSDFTWQGGSRWDKTKIQWLSSKEVQYFINKGHTYREP